LPNNELPYYEYDESIAGDDKYKINDELSKRYYGIKLWTMPQGKNIENTIKSITYDEEVFEIIEKTDENNITTLYFKLIQENGLPNTYKITIETYNGHKKSVYVNTHFDLNLGVGEENVPLGISVDKTSLGYLYFMSGIDDIDHQKQYQYNTTTYYDSIKKLMLTTNAKVKINFLNVMSSWAGQRILSEPEGVSLWIEGDERELNFADYISVSFSNNNYASYTDGYLTTSNLITANINDPIIMTITYRSARWINASNDHFEKTGEVYVFDGYQTYTHKIELYIYEPLDGVVVTSAKNADLYLDSSLGIFEKF